MAVTAGYGGGTAQYASVTVTPVAPTVTLSSIGISPATVVSGGTATVTLTLSGPAPSAGAVIAITNYYGTAFPTAASYTIPAGQSSASFAVQAGVVTASTAVTVGASYGGASQSATATVIPLQPAITAVAPNPLAVGTITVTVTGTGFLPGATVFLTFGSYSGIQLSTVSGTSSQIIATGYLGPASTATFYVKNPGGAASNSIDVPVGPTVTLSSIGISPATVASGGTATVTLTLSGPAGSGGASVNFSGSNNTAFPVPSSYLVPSGQSSVSFTVQAGVVTASTAVTLGASYGGAGQYASVTVTPVGPKVTLASIGISPATVASSGTATMMLTLSGPAGSSGAAVSVGSNNPTVLQIGRASCRERV